MQLPETTPTAKLPFRTAVSPAPRGLCVFVPSGKMTSFDDSSAEAALYERTAAELLARGIGVVQFDLPARSEDRDADLVARTACLFQLCDALRGCEPVAAFGVSLGAQSIVELLCAEDAPLDIWASVLASCVVDTPRFVLSEVHRIDFVYGSRDVVGYVTPGEETITLLRAEEYGRRSCDHLMAPPRTIVSMHVLDDVGHLLDGVAQPSPTWQVIADIIDRAIP